MNGLIITLVRKRPQVVVLIERVDPDLVASHLLEVCASWQLHCGHFLSLSPLLTNFQIVKDRERAECLPNVLRLIIGGDPDSHPLSYSEDFLRFEAIREENLEGFLLAW